ncbi:MAG: Carboxypeptidase regulatory-like domain [Acidobacteriaceae bacterium]|nr:Carboxypeptidase regulatory-like domain [Acidobacteriaceae bacterium]
MIGLLLGLVLSQTYRAPDCKIAPHKTDESSHLIGQVTDASGAPIPKAQVLLKPQANGQASYAITDNEGCFQFNALQGSYKLAARSPGFFDASREVSLDPSISGVINISLQVGYCNSCILLSKLWIEICPTSPSGLPVAPSNFVLTGTGPDRHRTYLVSSVNDWGCGLVRLRSGTYKLSITADGYQKLDSPISFQDEATIRTVLFQKILKPR